jgi:DNA-binding MarR family transcriptional regulator
MMRPVDPSRAGLFKLLQRDLALVVRRTAVPRVHERIVARAGVDIDHVEAVALSRIVDQGPMRLSELARQLVVACSTGGRHAAQLEDRGLCRRSVDPVDGRAVMVEATGAGRDLITRLRAAHGELLGEALSEWTREELADLTGLLGRLTDDLAPLIDTSAIDAAARAGSA